MKPEFNLPSATSSVATSLGLPFPAFLFAGFLNAERISEIFGALLKTAKEPFL